MKVTPMMKQFLDIKKNYKDYILLFRAGDFYETFYEDAKTVSKVLNITLTQRGGIPMAGVPYHSIMPYLKKLIANNFKVAICEQLEDPKEAKGIVKRGVTKLITPGTVIEDEFLDDFENNFIMSLYLPKNISEKVGLSLIDLSTGEFYVSEVYTMNDIRSAIKKFQPREVIFNEDGALKKNLIIYLKNNNIYFNQLSKLRYSLFYCNELIKRQFKKSSKDLGLKSEYVILSVGGALYYIFKLQQNELKYIKDVKYINLKENLVLDEITLRNLEIAESLFLRDNKKTLFGILNNTKTPMGARLLKKYLVLPFLDVNKINKIFDFVEKLKEEDVEREELRDIFEEIYDIERITTRISSKVAMPKDLISLKQSLKKVKEINVILEKLNYNKKLEEFESVINLIENAIDENAKNHIREIGFIKRTFNKSLEELYNISENSKDLILEIEEREKIKTGINNLKIKFNKIFGYYIEIPKTNSDKVPEYYERKQTLVNYERFTIPELKEKENLILNSEEKIRNLEKIIYLDILKELDKYVFQLQKLSKEIAYLDVITNNAYNAKVYNYIRPIFTNDKIKIIDGRNPIVERFTEEYIPNDISFNEKDTIKIITGPNMSGKSTALRMMGLISVMAQSGSFVPASKANLCIFDRIFTRIGAHDELAEGQSTFMVEMKETANILNNVSRNSLVLLDEIGRGTSTYDGLAIAWAVVEYLIDKNVKTMFATHYHYLNELEKYYDNVKNYHTEVIEEGNEIRFLRKMVPGGTDKSYGIYVAKIAGLPESVVKRAEEIQKNIEKKEEIKISFNKIKKRIKFNNNSGVGLDKFF